MALDFLCSLGQVGDVLLFVLLILKFVEMGIEATGTIRSGRAALLGLVAWRVGGSGSQGFQELRNAHRGMWSSDEWIFTRHLKRAAGLVQPKLTDAAPCPVACKSPLLTSPLLIFVKWIWRFPSLMLLVVWIVIASTPYCSGIPLGTRERWNLIAGTAVLFCGVWLEIAHTLLNRLFLGHGDSHFARPVSVNSVLTDSTASGSQGLPLRRDLIIRFARHFGAILVIVVLSYTAIYTGLNALVEAASTGQKAFVGVTGGWCVPLELYYFSVVTLATVGFGDISPAHYCLAARLSVATEIMAGMALLVFLLTTFSLTVDGEEAATEAGMIEKQIERLATKMDVEQAIERAVIGLATAIEASRATSKQKRKRG